MEARLLAAADGFGLRTTAIVIAQVWRETSGRQALLARLLAGVEIWPVDEEMGRSAGTLLGRAATSDPIDATLVLLARDGDDIITSDPADIRHLVLAAGKRVRVVAC